jgi:hypothetical protein
MLLLGGCLGFGESSSSTETAVVTQTGSTQAHRAEGDHAVAVAVPAVFTGMKVSSAATNFRGAEPSIGITSKGAVVATAYEDIVRSLDGGKTWSVVHHVGLGESFDPFLYVDPATNQVFAIHINPVRVCNVLATSRDDGATWTELPMRCPVPDVDHQKLSTGPYPSALAAAGSLAPYPQYTVLCYNLLGATHCAGSLDGGITYENDMVVDGTPVGDCGGLNGHQLQAPDGSIYVPYGFNCGGARVAVSADGGLTWTRHDLKQAQLEIDPELARTPDGTMYYLYRGGDQLVHLLRSKDGFATTQGPFIVSPPGVRSTAFLGMAAGSDGRVSFSYLGTTDTDAGPDAAPSSARWSLYAGMTVDGEATAPTIVTARVSPQTDPVQLGSICDDKACKDGNRNLLDFIDMSRGPDGRFWIAYADGCTSDACKTPGQTNPQTSRDDTLSIAYMAEGPSLLADKGTLKGPG